jgi:chemotaxis response regulator CheB
MAASIAIWSALQITLGYFMSSSASTTQSARGARRIRVIIVDDSALMRNVLSEIINDSPDFEVVGAASDPLLVREMIRDCKPDVMTLDVEMPKMDGLAFLEKLMRLRPMPVLMVSTLTESGSEITLRALELGAVGFYLKAQARHRTRHARLRCRDFRKITHRSACTCDEAGVASGDTGVRRRCDSEADSGAQRVE